MIKTSIPLLLFILSIPIISWSQEVEWSNMERFRNRTAYNKIIGTNEEGYYVLRSRNESIESRVILERFRETMGKDYSKRLPGMKGYNFIDAFAGKNGIVVFKSKFNNLTEKIDVFTQAYSNEGRVDGNRTLQASARLKNYSDDGDFLVVRENKESHYGLSYTQEKDRKPFLSVHVFNDTLGEERYAELELPFNEESYQLYDHQVDTIGNYYAVFQGVQPNQEKGSAEYYATYVFVLDTVSKWHTYYLNFKDTYISHPKLVLEPHKHRLIVTGFYSDTRIELNEGLLDFAVETRNFGVLHHSFIPFELTFMKELLGEMRVNDGSVPNNLVIRKVVSRSDGGFMVFGEEFSVSEQNYTYYINGMAQLSSRSVYNYGKIFIFAVNRYAEIEWSKLISKGQSSVNDQGYYSSFSTLVLRDRIHLFFNDKMQGGGGVMNFAIDNSGNMEGDLLFNKNGPYIAIAPSESKQVNGNTLLIPTAKDRKFAFVRLTF